jgi:hypothetical protein
MSYRAPTWGAIPFGAMRNFGRLTAVKKILSDPIDNQLTALRMSAWPYLYASLFFVQQIFCVFFPRNDGELASTSIGIARWNDSSRALAKFFAPRSAAQ